MVFIDDSELRARSILMNSLQITDKAEIYRHMRLYSTFLDRETPRLENQSWHQKSQHGYV